MSASCGTRGPYRVRLGGTWARRAQRLLDRSTPSSGKITARFAIADAPGTAAPRNEIGTRRFSCRKRARSPRPALGFWPRRSVSVPCLTGNDAGRTGSLDHVANDDASL